MVQLKGYGLQQGAFYAAIRGEVAVTTPFHKTIFGFEKPYGFKLILLFLVKVDSN